MLVAAAPERCRYVDNITFYDAQLKSLVVTGRPSDASKNKVLTSCSVWDVPRLLQLLGSGVAGRRRDDQPSRWRRSSCPGSLADCSLNVLIQNVRESRAENLNFTKLLAISN